MNARETTSHAGHRGFSLVELMVALVVTLIVSSAIYGLLTRGGNAFRREPEVADRQQNIRIAMDVIARDVDNAGAGLPVVSQVFTHTDTPATPPAAMGAGAPYLNGAGPQGVMGDAGRNLRGAPPTGAGIDTSDDSDILEMLMADSACPVFRVCTPAAGGPPTLNGSAVPTIHTREVTPANTCLVPPGSTGAQGLVALTDNRLFTIQPATLQLPDGSCGGSNGALALAKALDEWPTAGSVALAPSSTGILALLYSAKVVRYMIAPGLDPLDQSPGLWRSETGRYDSTWTKVAGPAAGATNNWQLVARGIEDLQVEYMNGNGLWSNNPGVVTPAATNNCTLIECNTVVRRVRVTLSARALAPLLEGATRPAAGPAPDAVRGQLVSVLTPRAAVLGLQAASNTSEFQ
jgi:prepilin-type N-terminal cleavage/methylation domain-containing protein